MTLKFIAHPLTTNLKLLFYNLSRHKNHIVIFIHSIVNHKMRIFLIKSSESVVNFKYINNKVNNIIIIQIVYNNF